jgi:hypothetical protein
MQLDVEAPLKVARWRPLVQWLLAIPHFIVIYALRLVASVVFVLSWFAILFTGKMPEGFFGAQCMVMRYQWRVLTYMAFMREPYPAFAFDTVGPDPGTDPARLSFEPPDKLSRGLIFVKWLLLIPHFLVLFVLSIGGLFVGIAGFFAVIITGAWPEGMRRYLIGLNRWSFRVNMYFFLMTDVYPPFSLD